MKKNSKVKNDQEDPMKARGWKKKTQLFYTINHFKVLIRVHKYGPRTYDT